MRWIAIAANGKDDTEGKLIGIEVVNPELVTLEAVNGALEDYGFQPLDASDLKPLLAA